MSKKRAMKRLCFGPTSGKNDLYIPNVLCILWFSYLAPTENGKARLVCKQWNRAGRDPHAWPTSVALEDEHQLRQYVQSGCERMERIQVESVFAAFRLAIPATRLVALIIKTGGTIYFFEHGKSWLEECKALEELTVPENWSFPTVQFPSKLRILMGGRWRCQKEDELNHTQTFPATLLHVNVEILGALALLVANCPELEYLCVRDWRIGEHESKLPIAPRRLQTLLLMCTYQCQQHEIEWYSQLLLHNVDTLTQVAVPIDRGTRNAFADGLEVMIGPIMSQTLPQLLKVQVLHLRPPSILCLAQLADIVRPLVRLRRLVFCEHCYDQHLRWMHTAAQRFAKEYPNWSVKPLKECQDADPGLVVTWQSLPDECSRRGR